MTTFIKKNLFGFFLCMSILIYISYFSFFTILRYRMLYASYYDLGIMNQTVYNTYLGIKQNDYSRILEMTDTVGAEQVKRMAVHNDIILAFLATFYFIYAGPETLLVIQTIILALGALAIFGIAKHVLSKHKQVNTLSFIFAIAYLFYTPMQRANIFDFHAVTLATSFLLFMVYFWLKKKNWLSILFFILSILTKEQVGFTTFMFGLYVFLDTYKSSPKKNQFKLDTRYIFPIIVCVASFFWVSVSLIGIIPFFRGKNHFALEYYEDRGLLKNIASLDTFRYLFFLLGPLGFMSFFSLVQLLIASPEFAVNLLSSNGNMHNIIYHYTSVIQPFVFLSSIYGVKKILDKKMVNAKYVILLIFTSFVLFSYFKGPLPFTREQEVHPFKYPQVSAKDIMYWANILKDDRLKISATGQVAPFFSSRRYLYLFSDRYKLADYIVIRREEIYNYPEKDILIPIYLKLQNDNQFEKIHNRNDLEVYKRK